MLHLYISANTGAKSALTDRLISAARELHDAMGPNAAPVKIIGPFNWIESPESPETRGCQFTKFLQCGGIIMLAGWETSATCRVEHDIALRLKKHVFWGTEQARLVLSNSMFKHD